MPVGFYHPKTCTHVRLLGPCFKISGMKSYDRQQPWHSVCILPLNSMLRFKCTACSPSLSKTNWEERGQPQRAYATTPLLDLSLTLQAITPTETSYLLTRLITKFQQLLTHTAGKCDNSDQKTNTDGPFGSIQCM